MSLFISIFKTLFRIGLGFAVIVVIAELTLQVLPVKTGFKRPASIEKGVPPHWQPNHGFTYSAGWRLDNPQKGWINNKGYPTPVDFQDGAEAVIVIGDSFVENQMNAWEESFMGLMAQDAPYPVYAFGLSGAQAADYIALAHHTAEHYAPRHMIIVMQPGDLSGATQAYQSGHFYIQESDQGWRLHQIPYSHKNAAIRNFFKQSALIRYVMMNLQLQQKLKALIPMPNKPSAPQEKPDLASRFEFMMDDMCRDARQDGFDITIVTESEELTSQQFKTIIQSCPKAEHSDALALKNYLKEENPIIRLTHEPYDGHWNATMHKAVYEAIKPTLPF